jgi:predicted metal-binding membrane protein
VEDRARGVTAAAPAVGRPRRGAPRPVLIAIAGGWALAVAAELTGTAGSLHHDALIEGGPPLWVALLLFLVAWQAMVAAMMLPSSLPLIRLFEAASAKQERPERVRAAFLAGYAAVWTGFGAIAFLGDTVVHQVVDAVPWLEARSWLIGGSALAVAGLFQFSELKDKCLSKCRMPGPYLLSHYRRGSGGAFRLGSGHGLFCLGCCWALMLVMFAAGVAVLWWMAALTAVMVYEKTGRYGAEVTRVVGVALLALAAVALAHPWLPVSLLS